MEMSEQAAFFAVGAEAEADNFFFRRMFGRFDLRFFFLRQVVFNISSSRPEEINLTAGCSSARKRIK